MTDKERIARMARLRHTINTDGWVDIRSHIQDEANASLENLVTLMNKTPERLTGRIAYRHSATYKAYNDLLSWVEDEIRDGEKVMKYVKSGNL